MKPLYKPFWEARFYPSQCDLPRQEGGWSQNLLYNLTDVDKQSLQSDYLLLLNFSMVPLLEFRPTTTEEHNNIKQTQGERINQTLHG